MVQAAHLHTLKKKKEIILYVLAEKNGHLLYFSSSVVLLRLQITLKTS